MAYFPVNFLLNGGQDRSMISHNANRGFYTMANFRQSLTSFGTVEQTPYFSKTTYSQGTYWDGAASATEPSDSGVFMAKPFYVSEYVVRPSAGSQLQVFYQETYPVVESVNTGCLLVINDLNNLAITLGSTVDVEIDAATTFRWRKNGGAWTAGVTVSTAGVSIDGGNATVYFLASSGFTIGHLWQWRRTDASFDDSSNKYTHALDGIFYKAQFYFTNVNDRVMVVKEAATDLNQYCISLGYRPVYGTFLQIVEDHLVVGRFAKSSIGKLSSPRAKTVGWSDVTDVENFIPTDTNEADQYTLPTASIHDGVSTTNTGNYITGLVVTKRQVYAFTLYEIYSSPYLGLPLVFSFDKFIDFRCSMVIRTFDGCYIADSDNVYYFDGSTLRAVGAPVRGLITLGYGGYDWIRREVIFRASGILYIYQERFDTWYSRSVDFGTFTLVLCIHAAASDLTLGFTERTVYTDAALSGTPAFDATDGTAYATPTLTFNTFKGATLASVKETSLVYLGASVNTAGASYGTDTNVEFNLKHYTSTNGLISGSSTALGVAWTTANADGTITFTPIRFHGVAFELTVTSATANPPLQAVVTALSANVYGIDKNWEPSR